MRKVFNPIIETHSASGVLLPEGEIIVDIKGNERVLDSIMSIFDPFRELKAREINVQRKRDQLLSEYLQLSVETV